MQKLGIKCNNMEIPELPEGLEASAVWYSTKDRCYYIQCIRDKYVHHFLWDGASVSWTHELIYRNEII